MYPQVFGKYVLERELSRGGMARVVLATLRGAGGFEKKLVVKQIRDELSFDQQFIRRFVEEAKTTVALSHPNIVPVYELGVEQGTYFLAMELVEGCSIAELVRGASGGRARSSERIKCVLSPEEGAYIGMEVCRALDYAHRRMKVVHRDITPRNVMLDEEGQVKLIDFGIAAPALVAGHEILGSPGHMPPEQVEGKELGPPTDIFAVAVLLMEAWTGIAPFRRATPEECDEAMRMPHPRPSDYNPRLIPLDDVIMRALKLDPRERQQDAADVARALRAFLQGTDVTDIARELGHRVRDLRQVASEPSPAEASGVRGPSPSVGDMGTQTFAAREEAIRWSRPPADEQEPPGASTRRLQESMPPAAEVVPLTPLPQTPAMETPEAPAAAMPAPETPPETPVAGMRVADTVRRKKVDRRDAAPSTPTPLPVQPSDEGRDTLATRPLETAVRGKDGVRSEPAAPRSRTWSIVALGAVFAIGAGVAWRARSESGRTQVTPTASTSLTVTVASATSATSTTSSMTATPTARGTVSTPSTTGTSPTAVVVVPPGLTHTAPQPSASAAEKPGRALVSFLGEPGTRVSIDGASRGACPVRVSLDPGQHDVRFQFDPTGESRGERFSVKANEKVTVRAEFTGATPTVRIQR